MDKQKTTSVSISEISLRVRHFDVSVEKTKNRECLENVFFHCVLFLAHLNEENSTWLVII